MQSLRLLFCKAFDFACWCSNVDATDIHETPLVIAPDARGTKVVSMNCLKSNECAEAT